MKNPKVIYFVDDDKAILNVLEYTLSSLKEWEIKTFRTGESFIENIRNRPDIVVLDYVLDTHEQTKMNGLDVLKKIKEYDSSIKVIVLSQFSEQKMIDKFIQYGAEKFIPKEAFFIDDLIVELDRLANES